MMKMMRKTIPLFILVLVAGGIFGLGSLRRGSDDKPILHVADEVPLTVNLVKPQTQDIVQFVQAPGDVEAVLEVEVRSEIVAKIDEMPVQEGSWVKKGDLLCRLNDDNLKAEVEAGQARVTRLKASIVDAEADFERAERDYRRQLRLSEVDATSDQERQNYITVFKKSKAQVDMRKQELVESEASLRRFQEDLKRTIITAPIDGIISKLAAKQGEVVVTGTMNNPGTVIMTISDLSKMQVRARVDEVDVPLVKPDQVSRVFLQADQQVPVAARVIRVAAKSTKVVGRDVVNFETILEVLSKDPRIRPGMTANVEIEVARRDKAVTVPVEAVVHRMRKDLPSRIVQEFDHRQANLDISHQARQAQYIKVIYIMDHEVARVRLIDTGIADSKNVELKGGLDPNNSVITGPYRSLDQLADGRKVKPAEEKKEETKTQEDKPGEEHLARR